MRGLLFVALAFGTPAFAHHEAVVATSMMPMMWGLIVFAMAVLAVLRRRFGAGRSQRGADEAGQNRS